MRSKLLRPLVHITDQRDRTRRQEMEISAGKYLRLGASLAGAQSQQHAKKREQLHSHSIGVTIRVENIGTAFELTEDYLQERNPQSDVIVQAVQRITNESTAALTPSNIIETNN